MFEDLYIFWKECNTSYDCVWGIDDQLQIDHTYLHKSNLRNN